MSRKQIVTVGIVLCMAFAMIVPAMAQTATPQPVTPAPTTVPPMTASTSLFATANFLSNVRSGPGRQYTILGLIRPKDAVDITGQTADGSWLRINFNGQEGWLSATLVNVTGDLTTAPTAEAGATAVLRVTANQTVTAELGTVVVIARVNANLRSTPSVNADVLAVIPFNTMLTVTGRTANKNWVWVTFNDKKGWVSSGTLIFSQGNLVNAPVVDDSGNPVPVTEQPTPEATTSP